MRLVLLLLIASVAATAEDHTRHDDALSHGDAQIVVTINPEARVSAALGAPLPQPSACGSPAEVKVKVINRGFVTAPLRASIVGDGKQHAVVDMQSTKLSGQPQDSRVLRITMHESSPVDLTIAFSIDNNIGDLGGRDRVHLLVQCRQEVAHDASGIATRGWFFFFWCIKSEHELNS